ncbi:hypothetical protein DESC_850015 [Desulfosarcina cetonica]|uniref:hypothetical protein n=1 Tax=Desulfosarcina cetonica TaxID=90730 RepID=UPI0006D11BCF|nr:hypothetical protein [Desulfosarcina cetonica]VTR70817.1 hypothetical protein DESC_850015 [Desulfosarcina cetonica]
MKTQKTRIPCPWALFVFAVMLMVALSAVNGSAGDTGSIPSLFTMAIDPDEVQPVRFNATIMEIKPGFPPALVVAEETIWVTTYRDKNLQETLQTKLLSKRGKTISIDDLEIDQRVIVDGLRLPDDTIVGQQIQIDSQGD